MAQTDVERIAELEREIEHLGEYVECLEERLLKRIRGLEGVCPECGERSHDSSYHDLEDPQVRPVRPVPAGIQQLSRNSPFAGS
jgi:hypothetical protein